jgi:receptor expression-enhancing protein 5/6
MSSSKKVQQHPVFIQAQDKANHYFNQFDKEVITQLSPTPTISHPTPQLTRYPALNAFEQRTQVPKAYAVLGGFFLLTILLAINPLASPVSNLVGWLLPAYLSFQAIESPSPHDDVQWLTYWVVFGFFNFVESFALRLVLYYFPWYFAFKTLFIVWLQLPAFRVRFLSFACHVHLRVTCETCTLSLPIILQPDVAKVLITCPTGCTNRLC